jgi:hypothetical protein
MIQITGTTEFDDSKTLSQQTEDFKKWYYQNVNILITDKLKPDSLDEYKRPKSYTVTVLTFTINISPIYIYQTQSNWACSDYKLIIKTI